MQLVTPDECFRFLHGRSTVRIGGRQINLRGAREVALVGPPSEYGSEQNTVWSFPSRGEWATHSADYPGNWSPYVPRNLIERFTTKDHLVLDPMMGSGTTLVECRLLKRNAIGIDINQEAIILANDRLSFTHQNQPLSVGNSVDTYLGDARNLNELDDCSIDLIATHPPYANIIRYGEGSFEGDLSDLSSVTEYVEAMRDVAAEFFRVLRKDRHCGILVGDTRVHAHYVPISYMVMAQFLAAGFVLKEDIIKVQHNTSSERGRWKGLCTQFYKIAHEHLFVFRKPSSSEECERLVLSTIRSIDPRWADE